MSGLLPNSSPAGNGGAFASAAQPLLPLYCEPWIPTNAADDSARALFHRHYSYKPRHGRPALKFVGPGEALVLLSPDARAVFVWRKFINDDGQSGINCALFRNEGAGLSSDLIRAADELAWRRWPGERHYTYVNPRKIRSENPGCCFLKAGWSRIGITKKRKYLILERTR